MNCDEVRDLAGAYALGRVSTEEKREIEDHMAGCNLHGEIAGLLATAAGLASAAPEMEPPARLGARISAVIRAEPDASSADPVAVAPVATPLRIRVRRIASWPVAAALLAAVGALVIWNVALQLDDPPENLVHFVKEPDGDWVRVEATFGEPGSTFSLGGFDQLPPGRNYQLWALRDDAAISLGVFNTDSEGNWSGDMNIPLERGDQIAITEEVAGGSSAPTMDPLISTRL